MRPGGRQRLQAQFRGFLLAVIVTAALGGVLWYRQLGKDSGGGAKKDLPRNDPRAEMVTEDFRHVETRMDRVVWVLEAKRAEMYEDSARLSTVKVTWYGDDERRPVVVTSQSGLVTFKTRDAVLSGDVRVVRSDGATLETEKIVWSDAEKTLTAPLPVSIRSRELNFRGNSLVANLERKWMRLDGAVRGDIGPGLGGPRGGEGHVRGTPG